MKNLVYWLTLFVKLYSFLNNIVIQFDLFILMWETGVCFEIITGEEGARVTAPPLTMITRYKFTSMNDRVLKIVWPTRV